MIGINIILILINIIQKSYQFHQDPISVVQEELESKILNHHITNNYKIQLNPFFEIEFKNIKFTFINYDRNFSWIRGVLPFNEVFYNNLVITIQFDLYAVHYYHNMLKDKPIFPLRSFSSISRNNTISLLFDYYIISQGEDLGYYYNPLKGYDNVEINFGNLKYFSFFKEELLNNENQFKNLFFKDIFLKELEIILTEYPPNKIIQLFREVHSLMFNRKGTIQVNLNTTDEKCKKYNKFKFQEYSYTRIERFANFVQLKITMLKYQIDYEVKGQGYHNEIYFDEVLLYPSGFNFGKMYEQNDCIKLAIEEISREYLIEAKNKLY